MQRLPLMEAYSTIQGEGFHQGKAAWFIRLGGCDVGCVWCDTPDSWDLSPYPMKAVSEILLGLAEPAPEIVVITGGEPLMHPLDELCEAIQQRGLKTNLETSGAHPLSGKWDWICLSPKKFKAPLEEICGQAHELKIIVANRSDLEWAEKYAEKINADCKLYLQAEWGVREKMYPVIADYISKHPQWQSSVQVHKYLGIK